MESKTFITYDAGNGEWITEPFNPNVEWHYGEFRGTKKECKNEAYRQMYEVGRSHYENAQYESIWDY